MEFSTDELAAAVNISRVSCRKYLIWLAQINILYTSIHYGATGRPVYRYHLIANGTACLSSTASKPVAVIQRLKAETAL